MECKTKLKQTEIGEIPKGWERVVLSDMAELVKDGYQPTGSDDFVYIGLEHIDQQLLRLNSIGHSTEVGSNKFTFQSGDILFGKLRPYFRKVYRPHFNGVCSTDIWVVRAKEDIDQGFLFYFMANQDFIGLASSGSSGTRMPRADWEHLKDTVWKKPPMTEQRTIAKILSDLDEKIELNHQMNKTLESMGQALFKRWFVDFEFPCKNGKPYKSSGGKMLDSELGEIPYGWKVGMLSDILELQIGGDWGEDDNFEGAARAVSLRGTDLEQLKSCGYAINAPVRWIKKGSLGKRHIDDCDILIGGSGLGPIGRSIYCSSEINSLYQYPVTYSNFCKRLSSEIPAYAVYAECILENMYRSEKMKQYFTGTSIPNLDTNSLLSYEIVIPPKAVTTWFYQIVKNKYARLYNNENTILSQIRDSLLPKLMSGKLLIP